MNRHTHAGVRWCADTRTLTIAAHTSCSEPICVAAYAASMRIVVGDYARVVIHDELCSGGVSGDRFIQLGAYSTVTYRDMLCVHGELASCPCASRVCEKKAPMATVRIHVALRGVGSCFSGRLCIVRGNITEFELIQEHEASHTISACAVKEILPSGGRSVLKGCIHVASSAAHVCAQQQLRGIMLDDSSEPCDERTCSWMQMAPMLAVANHTAHVTHGCAVGCLDAEQLLYMQMRGLALGTAKKLLIGGFLACD